ncbi:MAG: hypothetical protein SGJ11_10075 [Phycisphaerae bacterium]|nr:hypothetical protein [Phycisphaerae bacterium]
MPNQSKTLNPPYRALSPVCGIGLAACLVASIAGSAGADVFNDVGYTALVARLGAAVPTGAGYGVGQVEAEETPGNFGPNTASADFFGKVFTAQSGPFGSSGHATSVGLALYGNTNSIAPGVTDIFVWSAGNWATTGFLRTNQGASPPLFPPAGMRIFNHSWVGSFGSTFLDNDALRRFDFEVSRDNVFAACGTNNGAGSPPFSLVGYGFNQVTVGVDTGSHSNAVTPPGLDGQGRRKPEIVAPATFTSFSTPIIGAAAALLFHTTDLDPGLIVNPNADRAVVIKSVLLAGANHRPGWSNGAVIKGPSRGTTSTPLDPLYGADLLNIDRSHFILTGQEQNGSATVPAMTTVSERGWDYIFAPAANTSQYYRFKVYGPADELSVLATWNRSVAANFSSFTLMDLDLQLWQVDGTSLQSLVGNDGLGVFDAGNVTSSSTIDNVEHLYINGLQAGEYVIELRRKPGAQAAMPVAISWYITDTGPLGDLNGDNIVNAADLALLLGAWGTPGLGDLNDDGIVDASDLAIMLGAWG